MKTIHDLLHERLLSSAGLLDPPIKGCTIANLERSEWSSRFERLMRNRLIIGALRYGLLNAKNKRKYNRIAGAYKRLDQYVKTGNLECLVDVANMMLLEFEEGLHPLKHWHDLNEDHCCPH